MGVVALLSDVRVAIEAGRIFQGRTKIAPNRQWRDARSSFPTLGARFLPGFISVQIDDVAQVSARPVVQAPSFCSAHLTEGMLKMFGTR